MDPFTVSIVSALAAGAVAAAKDVATSAVKDAYAGLKRIIADRYQSAEPFAAAVEEAAKEDFDSRAEQMVLAKKLANAGAASDEDLKIAAQALLEAVESLKSDSRAAALFDFKKVRAMTTFEVTDPEVAFGQTFFRAEEATFEGPAKFSGIRQKGGTEKN